MVPGDGEYDFGVRIVDVWVPVYLVLTSALKASRRHSELMLSI